MCGLELIIFFFNEKPKSSYLTKKMIVFFYIFLKIRLLSQIGYKKKFDDCQIVIFEHTKKWFVFNEAADENNK